MMSRGQKRKSWLRGETLMFSWICQRCGREILPSYEECPHCAAKTEPANSVADESAGAGSIEKAYILVFGGKEIGPYLSVDLQRIYSEGRILPHDLTREIASTEWVPVASLLGLGARSTETYCEKCGKKLQNNALFYCTYCLAPRSTSQQANPAPTLGPGVVHSSAKPHDPDTVLENRRPIPALYDGIDNKVSLKANQSTIVIALLVFGVFIWIGLSFREVSTTISLSFIAGAVIAFFVILARNSQTGNCPYCGTRQGAGMPGMVTQCISCRNRFVHREGYLHRIV